MRRFQCVRCGYVSRGPVPPAVCPVCGAPASDFQPLAGLLAGVKRFPNVGWWLIHVVGIAAVFTLGVVVRDARERARKQSATAMVIQRPVEAGATR